MTLFGRGEAAIIRYLWTSYPNTIACRRLDRMIDSDLIVDDIDETSTKTSTTSIAKRDFAYSLYETLTSSNAAKAAAFAPARSTWFTILRAAIQHTSREAFPKARWIEGIEIAMQTAGVEWAPGHHRQRLSHRRILRLIGILPAAKVLAAPPGSLKRAALEASQQMLLGPPQKRFKQQQVDFRCSLPFPEVPPLVNEGFAKLEGIFAKGDQRVLEHYHQARICQV